MCWTASFSATRSVSSANLQLLWNRPVIHQIALEHDSRQEEHFSQTRTTFNWLRSWRHERIIVRICHVYLFAIKDFADLFRNLFSFKAIYWVRCRRKIKIMPVKKKKTIEVKSYGLRIIPFLKEDLLACSIFLALFCHFSKVWRNTERRFELQPRVLHNLITSTLPKVFFSNGCYEDGRVRPGSS